MIVGAPHGHFVGDPVDTGSLTRQKYPFLGSSKVTFGAASGIFGSSKTLVRDLRTNYYSAISPLNILNSSGYASARYNYNDLYITIQTLLDVSGGLVLNRITSDTTVALATTLGSFFPRPFISSRVGIEKGRFDQGKLPNGN